MRTRDIMLSSLFGVAISLQKALLPAPYDKIVSVLIQIVFLSLAFLLMGFMGPILTGLISGLLTASLRGGLAPLTFSFALLYGLLVSFFNRFFDVMDSGVIRKKRFIASTLLSTLLVGVSTAFVSIYLKVIPFNLMMVFMIMAAGFAQGAVGGYLSILLWEKYLHHMMSRF